MNQPKLVVLGGGSTLHRAARLALPRPTWPHRTAPSHTEPSLECPREIW